jgi:tetratricopeptide (TPR) repeat protein
LARLDAYLYLSNDPSPERLAQAKRDVEEARRISPDDPQTITAEGYYDYYCRNDYQSALAHFDAALRRSPNDADVLLPIAFVHRKQGKFQQSLDELSQILALDPDNDEALAVRSDLLSLFHKYAAARADVEREIALAPQLSGLYAIQAQNIFAGSGDAEAARRELLRAPMADDPDVIEAKVYLSLVQHDCKSALSAFSSSSLRGTFPVQRNALLQVAGETQVLCGEKKQGTAQLQEVLANWDRFLAQKPRMNFARMKRAECLAYLGRRDDALREAHLWAELTKVNPWGRIIANEKLAEIYALSGDGREAINTLEQQSHLSYSVNAEELRRHPKWAPLRADPRFPKLLAAWKPL